MSIELFEPLACDIGSFAEEVKHSIIGVVCITQKIEKVVGWALRQIMIVYCNSDHFIGCGFILQQQ